MRGGIIITLVVVGGLLVAAPLLVGYLERTGHQANVVRLLEKPEVRNVNLQREDIPVGAQVGCWAVGLVLALTGVVLAVRELQPAFRRPARPE